MGDTATTVKDMTAPTGNQKTEEPSRDGSTSSIASSPEPDPETFTQDHPQQQQKRKGGRKPIYATSEERKQRNRQAQAAFRERRTEYIKQLESTIKKHEEALQSLQQSHRSAADECLMLRYKNSLLERILLEKGIDVQAELQAKTQSPNLGPTRVPAPPVTVPPAQKQPMQRAIMNRQQQRRSGMGLPQKIEGAHGLPNISPNGLAPNRSPLSQPTPTSHMSSPSTTATRSPNFLPQGAIQSPNIGPVSQQQQQLRQQQHRQFNQIPHAPPLRPTVMTSNVASGGIPSAASAGSGPGSAMPGNANAGSSSFYPSPFQSHMDQLEQEYDAQADIVDDEPSDQSAGPNPYAPAFPIPIAQQGVMSNQTSPNQAPSQAYQSPATLQPSDSNANGNFGLNQVFDPYDPMLDADPFGLSASMHFPTQFSYETR